MWNVKRRGFKPNIHNNPYLRPQMERFSPEWQTRPYCIYMLVSRDGDYAITSETGVPEVFLDKPDKKNKGQWLFIDTDTGAIAFFYDMKNYFSIRIVEGNVQVTRDDIIQNGIFDFKGDFTIQLRNNPSYKLGYYMKWKEGTPQPGSDAGTTQPATAADAGTTQQEGTPQPQQESTPPPAKEGFFASMWRYMKEGFMQESFNKDTAIMLEAINVTTNEFKKNEHMYAMKWKAEKIYDLREMTDNADTIEELTKVGLNNDTQITALQKIIDSNKQITDIETKYRDGLVARYEQNWFIDMFLKPKVDPEVQLQSADAAKPKTE